MRVRFYGVKRAEHPYARQYRHRESGVRYQIFQTRGYFKYQRQDWCTRIVEPDRDRNRSEKVRNRLGG